MATVKSIKFSVAAYDCDGDMTDSGVFLHFGDTRVKAADTLADFRTIVDHFEAMVREVDENYG